ncbi:MAG: glutaredoxin family protein [Coriobacteriales bacterium]
MPELVLYKADWCPYCRRVLRFIDTSWKHDASRIAVRDIDSDPGAREQLARVGGREQVPCLFVDGEPLYESNDIIAYLDTL